MKLGGREDLTLFFGSVKSRKQVLVKYMTRDESLEDKVQPNGFSIAKPHQDASKMPHPNLKVDPFTGELLVDLPCYDDRRDNPLIDISATFLTKKIIQEARTFKLIIVESDDFLNQSHSTKNRFLRTLKNLAHMLPDVSNLEESIGLVVTNVKTRKNPSDFIVLVKRFLKKLQYVKKVARKSKLYNVVNQILDILAKGKNNIAIQLRPSETTYRSVSSDYEHIRYVVLDSLNFTDIEHSDFKFPVYQKSAKYIRSKLLASTEKEVVVGFQKFAHNALHHLVTKTATADLTLEDKVLKAKRESKRFLKHLKRPKGFVFTAAILLNLRTDLKFQSEQDKLILNLQKLDFFYDAIDLPTNNFYHQIHLGIVKKTEDELKELITSYQFVINLRNFLDSYNWLKNFFDYNKNTDIKEKMKIYKSITTSNFPNFIDFMCSKGFKETHKKFKLHLAALSDLNYVWKDAMHANFKAEKFSGPSLIVSGSHVLLSTIRAIHGQSGSYYQYITIIATTKIYIDYSLSLLNTHLTLIAPYMVVVGKQVFNLYGENGTKIQTNAYDESAGKDGLPGYRSGIFTLMTFSIINGENLNVFLEGGMGGSGQNGGNGRVGSSVQVNTNKDDVHREVEKHRPDKFSCAYYTFKRSCHFSYTLHSYSTGSNGARGGDGIVGAPAGNVILRVPGNKTRVGIISKTGRNGKEGIGGRPGYSICISRTVTAKCFYRWMFGWKDKLNSCNYDRDYCSKMSDNKRGPNGKIKRLTAGYLFRDLSSANAISTYFSSVFNNTDKNTKQSSEFFAYLLKNPQNFVFYSLGWFYATAIEVFTTKMNNAKLSETVAELHSAFKVFRIKKAGDHTADELYTLELAFITELDLLEATKSKRQVIKIEAELRRLQQQSNTVSEKLTEIYKYDTVKQHMAQVKTQIDQGEELTKQVMKNDLAQLGNQINEQVNVLVSKVKQHRDENQKNTQQLKNDREEYKSNLWKRIITAPLNILTKLVSVVKPRLAESIGAISEAAENALIHKTPPAEKIILPAGVENAKRLKSEIVQIELQGEQAKKKIYAKGIEDTLNLDNRFNRSVLAEVLRKKLEASLRLLEDAKYQPTEQFEEDVQNIVGEARAIIEGKQNQLSDEKSEATSIMRLVEMGSFLSPPIAEEAMKFLGDFQMIETITDQIHANRVDFEKLQQYEEDVHNSFKPQLTAMIDGFEQLGKDGSQSTDFELQFKHLDLRNMIRNTITFIQKFTAGFLDEDQNEFVRIISDVEATMASVLKNYEKVNDLKYKMQFSALVGTLQLGRCNLNSELCKLRLKLEAVMHTNILRQKYYHVERAYRQNIFPFVNKNLEHLSSIDVMDVGDYETVSKGIKVKVEKMLDLLEDSKNWIDNNADQNVHLTEFNPIYKSSAEAFYTWLQPHHSDQIHRLLSGESVTFIADVRHRKVHNAVKFSHVSINLTSFEPQANREIQKLMQYLQVTLEHGGENHFRCQDDYYVVGGGPETPFKHSFEHNRQGELVSQNLVQRKFSLGDVLFSPYTVWRFQLKQRGASTAQLQELAKWAKFANVELIGRGSFLDENDAACKKDLQKYFDVFE